MRRAASLGYRTFVAGRLYVSGNFEAASHGGGGMNARFVYAPGRLLCDGGPVYDSCGRPELTENGRKIVEAFDGLTSVYPDQEETNE